MAHATVGPAVVWRAGRAILLSAFLIAVATMLGRLHSGEPTTREPFSSEPRWWKGNLHTHSFWSDGDDFPEMIVEWYREHGYNFLGLSDHNVLSEGDKWVDAERHRGGAIVGALAKYRQRFGPWVEERQDGERPLVRLKPLNEFRPLFDRPGQFLLIQSEEITDKFDRLPVHLNATNLREVIAPQGGNSVLDVLQRNVNAVLEQRQRTGQPMFVHVNHPNFGWGVRAEDLIPLQGEQFFEIYNGHSGVRNYGDSEHPGLEAMWDMILAARLSPSGSGQVMYGLGTDDAHHYHQFAVGKVNPGRGWVMVRARHLTPESIVLAMERGDFYASTGVRLRDVGGDGRSVWLSIDGEPGVNYQTEFVGSVAARAGDGQNGSAKVSEQVGVVLASSTELKPVYEFTGREIYVRARVKSSKLHSNPYAEGDYEMAWTQPVAKPAR